MICFDSRQLQSPDKQTPLTSNYETRNWWFYSILRKAASAAPVPVLRPGKGSAGVRSMIPESILLSQVGEPGFMTHCTRCADSMAGNVSSAAGGETCVSYFAACLCLYDCWFGVEMICRDRR